MIHIIIQSFNTSGSTVQQYVERWLLLKDGAPSRPNSPPNLQMDKKDYDELLDDAVEAFERELWEEIR